MIPDEELLEQIQLKESLSLDLALNLTHICTPYITFSNPFSYIAPDKWSQYRM